MIFLTKNIYFTSSLFMKKLKNIFEKIFNISINNKDFMNLKINDIEEWDSMANLDLIFEVEKEFDFKFTTKEMENVSSVKYIYDYLKSKKKI